MQYRFNPLIQLQDEGTWQVMRWQMMQPHRSKGVSSIKGVSNIKKRDHNCQTGVTTIMWRGYIPYWMIRSDRFLLTSPDPDNHDYHSIVHPSTLRSMGQWQQSSQGYAVREQAGEQEIFASTVRLFCLFRRLFIQLRWQQESGA